MEENRRTTENKIRVLGESVTAPLLYPFVRWVLSECGKRGIMRIYFLARDGYILKMIAEKLCAGKSAPELRYLYCSRYALRLPLYHLLGDEGMEQLTCSAAENSAQAVFARAGLSDDEISRVMNDISAEYPPEALLNKNEFNELRCRLKNSAMFREIVRVRSSAAFGGAVGYFRQEGLFGDEEYAVVDSGWSGSMQRSLRQLLELAGCKKRLVGYYFGMFTRPVSEEDGEYNTFYFSADSAKTARVKFCNNLFECMVSAPHAMTIGYEETGGGYVPVFQSDPPEAQLALIKAHHEGIMSYHGTASGKFDREAELREERKRVARIMTKPDVSEAESYGALMFSDDVSGENECPLASAEQLPKLKNYSVPIRAFKRFFGRKSTEGANLFWPYGTIAFAPAIKRGWYRLNVYIWEWLRLTLKK